MPEPQIVRERELGELVGALEEAAAGRGSIVFVPGHAGSGRTTLLRALEEEAGRRDSLERLEVVAAACYEIDRLNPLAPFLEILRDLATADRRWTKAKQTLELVHDVAPMLLGLIPGLGPLAAVGVKAAAAGGIVAIGDRETKAETTHVNLALTLVELARKTPLALLIDDAQWMDDSSAHVVERLARMPDAPLALVIAYDDALGPAHPLARLLGRAAPLRNVRTVPLEDLDEATIEATLVRRYGSAPHPRLAEWLHDRTDGTPYFLLEYLRALEEGGALRQEGDGWALDGTIDGGPGHWRLGGALAEVRSPSTMLGILEPQVDDLSPEEKLLLESASVQGRHFVAHVVARLVEQDEPAVRRGLQEVARRRRMIAPQRTRDWWTTRTARYSFDPAPLQEVLYAWYAESPFDAQDRHRAVADALDELLADETDPPRHAVLELARHRELAQQPLAAAELLADVAASAYAEGADREAGALAAHAVELLETLGGDERRGAAALLARALLLVLLGGEPTWRGGPDEAGSERLFALAERAEAAARESGDALLQANARYATATVRVAHESLESGLAALEEARALAREAADPVAEVAILLSLGHHKVSQSVAAGRALLREAQAILASDACAEALDEAQLGVETARLDSVVGVAEFDLGNYGEALRLLTGSSQGLREARLRYDAAWALAFLAQVYTAVGLYEAAESTLRDAIGIFADDRGDLGTRGYLRALLGRAYLEWEQPRLDEARRELERARAETIASGYRPVLPLVQTHWAELLVAEGTEEALAEADEVLAETAREAREFGWARSEIAAGSLRARIVLARGRGEEAVELSTAATALLAERGGAVPAVRSEEILYAHHLVLAAAGAPGADAPLDEAAAVVRAKADSLGDDALRQSFLTRVRLSRDVLAAAGG